MKSEKSMKRLISKTNYSAIEEVNKQAYYKKYNDRDIKAREDVKRLIQSDRNTCRNVFSTLI
jgi:trehalose/maltose hydrolase-like predicted phosphorylase